ncbi:uncharacterized protein EAE98_003767 [Botrytis deweyae]|uniref:Rhodopsin domain-containing protein n=1 Tax=Botrytis deweyae TaxID=2478750 RepID=A0ABQ7IRN3_9HELO|nr:uncharacterized protein EAE98_003767 [Botrytis deweyae]KAF7932468.1 hypothetical protein EAE98_003767 [Botrytis deweyae]
MTGKAVAGRGRRFRSLRPTLLFKWSRFRTFYPVLSTFEIKSIFIMNRTQVFITDTNKTPLIELFVWVPLSISCLGVAARLATKIAIFKKLHLQDHLVSISLLLAIGQSIAVTIQCSNGYGQHLSTLSTSHQEGLLKAGYAANLLFIASLCFVKLSIASFIDDLTPITRERQAAKAIGLIILLWTISSIFSSAFQCSVPRPWDRINGSCINQRLGITMRL